MAAYVTPAELRAVVPNQFRDAALADSSGGDAADPGLLSAVIEAACDEVDALIEGRVLLPLSSPPKKVKIAARYIALSILFMRRGLELPKDAADAVDLWKKWLQKAGEGDLRLAAPAESDAAGRPAWHGSIASRPSVTGSSGLIGCLLIGFALLSGTSEAADARRWQFALPNGPEFSSPDFMEWAQAENVALAYTNAPAESLSVRWEVIAGTNLWIDAEATQSRGRWTWTLTPTNSALPAGRYDGRVALYGAAGSFVRIAAIQSIRVHASPRAVDLALATPMQDVESRLADWMAQGADQLDAWERDANAELAAITNAAAAALENLGMSSMALIHAATNVVVESIGGPLFADFASVVYGRVHPLNGSTSGWAIISTDPSERFGNVMARPQTMGLAEVFGIAFTNVRSSVPGVPPSIVPGTNFEYGVYSADTYRLFNQTTGLHWRAGVEAGATGRFDVVLNSYTGTQSRIFPGYGATTNIHVFDSFAPGSLRAAVDADMTNRLATGEMNPFSPMTMPGIQRNPNLWIGDMDVTCVSPYNSLGQWTHHGTLVTPQHFVFASHWPTTTETSSGYDGKQIYWVDATNGVHQRTIVKARKVDGDCSLGLVDSPLPATIAPAKILSTNDFAKFNGVYCTTPSGLVGPSGMIAVHAWQGAFRAMRVPFDDGYRTNLTWWSSRDPTLRYSDIYNGTNYVGGQSGSAVLLHIDGQTVIAQTLHSPGGAGPNIAVLRDKIEALMPTLGASVYTNLTTINLYDWPSYQ